MAIDFDLKRCTRRCAKSGRELKPGEAYYSVLQAEGAAVVRQDFAIDHWDGPPPDVIGFWKGRIPEADVARVHWAPNDVILHYFEQLESQADKQDERYVLALLMIRRRIVRLEESDPSDDAPETMILNCPRKQTEYAVVVTQPSAERITEIQQKLADLLFADADQPS